MSVRRPRWTPVSASRHVRAAMGMVVAWGAMVSLTAGAARGDDGDAPLPFPMGAAWTADLGQGLAAAPAYDETHAYVPLRDGTLTAVRLADGDVAWSVTTHPTQFSPAAGDGIVVVASDTALSALRVEDAEPLWVRDVGSAVAVPPLLSGGWLIAGLTNGDAVALRAGDGEELWRASVGGTLQVRPTVAGNELFVPVEDGRVVALDLLSGTQVWERTLTGSPREVLPLDAVFVGTTGNYLYRLSRESGRVDWRWRTGGDVVGMPTVDQDRVYFVSLDNILWALDRNTGVQRWRQPLTGRPRSGPMLVGDLLIVSGVAARLRVFSSETGRLANVLQAPGELGAPPRFRQVRGVGDPPIVLVVADGRLVGMGAASGPPQFALSFPPPPLLPRPQRLRLSYVLSSQPLSAAPVPQAAGVDLSNASGPPESRDASVGTPIAEPTTSARPGAEPAEPAQSGYVVQVGAFRDEALASALRTRLLEHGYAAYLVASGDAPDSLHRVWIGRALSSSESTRLIANLDADLQLEAVVVTGR